MIDPLMPCGPLSCAYPGCRAVAKYVDANCEFIDGHALVIVDGGKAGFDPAVNPYQDEEES